jgi:hypothetical protein
MPALLYLGFRGINQSHLSSGKRFYSRVKFICAKRRVKAFSIIDEVNNTFSLKMEMESEDGNKRKVLEAVFCLFGDYFSFSLSLNFSVRICRNPIFM